MSTAIDWGTHGVGVAKIFTLNSKHRGEFQKIISDRPNAAQFIDAIEAAIAEAKEMQALRETVKPAAVRKNLRKTLLATDRLMESLCEIDQLSKYLINESPGDNNFENIQRALEDIRTKINYAVVCADKYQQKGKLYQGHCRWLSYLVAAAINDVLGIVPSLSHNDPSAIGSKRSDIFAQCLALALTVAKMGPKNPDPVSLIYLMKEGLLTLDTRILHTHTGTVTETGKVSVVVECREWSS